MSSEIILGQEARQLPEDDENKAEAPGRSEEVLDPPSLEEVRQQYVPRHAASMIPVDTSLSGKGPVLRALEQMLLLGAEEEEG